MRIQASVRGTHKADIAAPNAEGKLHSALQWQEGLDRISCRCGTSPRVDSSWRCGQLWLSCKGEYILPEHSVCALSAEDLEVRALDARGHFALHQAKFRRKYLVSKDWCGDGFVGVRRRRRNHRLQHNRRESLNIEIFRSLYVSSEIYILCNPFAYVLMPFLIACIPVCHHLMISVPWHLSGGPCMPVGVWRQTPGAGPSTFVAMRASRAFTPFARKCRFIALPCRALRSPPSRRQRCEHCCGPPPYRHLYSPDISGDSCPEQG